MNEESVMHELMNEENVMNEQMTNGTWSRVALSLVEHLSPPLLAPHLGHASYTADLYIGEFLVHGTHLHPCFLWKPQFILRDALGEVDLCVLTQGSPPPSGTTQLDGAHL